MILLASVLTACDGDALRAEPYWGRCQGIACACLAASCQQLVEEIARSGPLGIRGDVLCIRSGSHRGSSGKGQGSAPWPREDAKTPRTPQKKGCFVMTPRPEGSCFRRSWPLEVLARSLSPFPSPCWSRELQKGFTAGRGQHCSHCLHTLAGASS